MSVVDTRGSVGLSRSQGGSTEPIFLASQLASMCDVDLKTIHNWCARPVDGEGAGELECFRTEGGHLRFRHASVLRFFRRWGYPVPDALVADRPHVLLVEEDEAARVEWIKLLALCRPGDEHGAFEGGETVGLWCTPRYYLHLWADPYAALIALGERVGAGMPPDLVVLSSVLGAIDAQRWFATARALVGPERFRGVLCVNEDGLSAVTKEHGVVAVIPRRHAGDLATVLAQQTQLIVSARPRPKRRAPRRRRLPIAPREPLFVASQVATLWGVDLKTVHHWVERGDVEAFRTPGRHLRFRRRALLHLLRRYDKPVPEDIAPERPTVLVVAAEGSSLEVLRERLAPRFEVQLERDAADALGAIGRGCAGESMIDAVVIERGDEGIDPVRWSAALRSHPDTRYSLLFAVGFDESQHEALRAAGVSATMAGTQPEVIEVLLLRALGA